ncbi:MAG: cell division protein ZipA C-terminal FtsZ-binding domain-containing protein [Steroidobacteraceae bacterium]
MPQLRLTLLVVGLIFLIGLAWWELRRSHQARGSELPRPTPEPPDHPGRSAEWDSATLELPRMSARSPELDLPVVEVEPEEFAALAAQAEPAELSGMDGLLDEVGAQDFADPPISDLTETGAAAPEAAPAPAAAEPLPERAPAVVVVDWPAADASQVIAVRLISSGEKFSGRAVRLALAAEGFELGKFAIFHKPAADGRALLSIASLNKPGTFDRQSIDLQRYTGLNLFTVLPGPVPGPDAVDEMLMCAQVLSRRLRGTLQDERGEPLTPSRTAVMRDVAAAAPQ